ncbi:MAG: phosphatase PAP2 family protein [Thermocrispum sp.]
MALPPALRAPMAVAAVAAAIVLAALAVLYAADARLWTSDGVEGPIIGQPFKPLALAIDFLAEPAGAAVLVPALVIGCLLFGRRRLAVLAVAGPVLTVGATTAIKPLVGRTIHGDHLSFPSGHTALLTVLGLILALLLADRLRPGRAVALLLVLGAAVAFGGAMAWAQTVLSAHYATDTVGGFCTALTVVTATAWAIDRYADRAV